MRAALFLILSGVLLFSCTETTETKIRIDDESVKTNASIDKTDATQKTPTLPEGDFISNYPNGVKKVEGQVLNGKRTGVWIAYYPNGIKQSENTYINGMLNGKTVVYHENGLIMYIGYYKNGKYEGNWIYFNEEGVELKSLSYKNGKQL